MKNPNQELVLSIDIGGSKTATALVDKNGQVKGQDQFPTEVGRGPQDLCHRIRNSFTAKLGVEDFSAFLGGGISAPGPLSSSSGCFLNPPNMPGWHGFPIKKELEEILGCSLELMNDANAAACGEYAYGAGRGSQTMIFFTMSTGMGAGLIIGGQLHEGIDDMAGEVGHTIVNPGGPIGFGRSGSLEGYCSGPGIAQLAVGKLIQALHRDHKSLLFDLNKDWRLVTCEDVGAAARQGDSLAQDCFRECGKKLGIFCADLVDLLNPEVIVLGTIGRLYADFIIPAAEAEIKRIAHPQGANRVKILGASLADSLPCLAGAAAFWARQ